ncbi:hypothetical protein GCM10023194_78310 [Planotetraspora phitsanulokensis]|uniref:Uncharacterized protein n=1 Tax=Planotetraspora phitsanulokensis TaxID=575192 RepID=A0A8J3UAC2_9ACTN|nr:hypothetical protein [Planotetraspora phitsanulokensis]GII41117.1 hypothetical protein Pph01_61200 [Planotetraspora phitsanulokensis]
MTLAPYTHVTMSIQPGEAPHIGVSFHTPDLRASASVLNTGRPYLGLDSNEARVSVSTTGAGPVTTKDLDVARQIFNAAARYLADCERLHTQQPATPARFDAPGDEVAA